jgi:hypothetical protein
LLGTASFFGIADVDNAFDWLIANGVLSGILSGPRPDYIYFLANSSGVITEALIVECKGTAPRGGAIPRREETVPQLITGARQAAARTIAKGCPTRHLVFGSLLRDLRWTVHCLEVPAKLVADASPVSPAALVAADSARLLAFAGMYRSAGQILGKPDEAVELQAAQARQYGNLRVDGHALVVATESGLIEIFHGVDIDMLAAAAAPKEERAERLAARQHTITADIGIVASTDENGRRPVRLHGEGLMLATLDGCLQSIRAVDRIS